MSFSGDVKDELVRFENDARHCQIAELAAILMYAGLIKTDDLGATHIEVAMDDLVMQRCHMLLDRLFGQQFFTEEQFIQDANHVRKVLQMIKHGSDDLLVNPLLIKSFCCKRAFLRGAFLSVGSMSNPEKAYHLEYVCVDTQQAAQLIDILLVYGIHAKTVVRKKYQVVYIKESEEIVELLNVIGAHISLMKLENLRIFKDMRNSINRRVNCETANITKTVNAATKQIADIQYIKEHYGFDNLKDNLRQVAELRLEYPDAALKELGEYLSPPVGKSGVNHRLRKLSELAEKLRGD
ncbi:MAG: DNA-binding protein WhiA [Lachnospiraceae bacterium]|nr:DNA-binding protein WhiA [Lachnospiraceae bacterium]HBV84582.1 DNA-binding protein WhiA [Lachnospiraceae bacterium]